METVKSQKLNASNTTGIFCLPTCNQYAETKYSETFSSVADALKKGYRPCNFCKPIQNEEHIPTKMLPLIQFIEDHRITKTDTINPESFGLNLQETRAWFLDKYHLTFRNFLQLLKENSTFLHDKEETKSSVTEIAKLIDVMENFMPNPSDSGQIIKISSIETPIGNMIAAATETGICMLNFADYHQMESDFIQLAFGNKTSLTIGKNRHHIALRKQLDEYFAGKRKSFDVPLVFNATLFQYEVWQSLLKIPYGQVISYAQQAASIGKPKAVRAVANANGQNLLTILVPCHRVIGSNGKLTGYGGGMWRKMKLLELEKAPIF